MMVVAGHIKPSQTSTVATNTCTFLGKCFKIVFKKKNVTAFVLLQ